MSIAPDSPKKYTKKRIFWSVRWPVSPEDCSIDVTFAMAKEVPSLATSEAVA
jgi:hypothetical protein